MTVPDRGRKPIRLSVPKQLTDTVIIIFRLAGGNGIAMRGDGRRGNFYLSHTRLRVSLHLNMVRSDFLLTWSCRSESALDKSYLERAENDSFCR